MTPKSLLRSSFARSATRELEGGHFRETIDDPWISAKGDVERVLLCTGKVAYALKEERDERSAPAAIVRVEQLYPFPKEQLQEILAGYPNAAKLCWVQEEPENMGAWGFMDLRLRRLLDEGRTLSHAARAESASPATGNHNVHEQEQEELLATAFEN
jgi:2-oxoglutarate decarboxylase